ncbi:MAG: SCO family protein [Gemmatimonadales bacterium]
MTGARWALLLAAIAGSACGRERYSAASFNGYVLNPPFAKPAVVWHLADGTPFDVRRETAGRVTLLFFGYTHCPDICPMQLANIAAAFQRIGADTAAKVQVLFVTVDPKRDTGEVLNHWVHAIDPRFTALRGDTASVNAEIARFGLAPPTDDPQSATVFSHASSVIAFARDDSAHFAYPSSVNPEAWAHDLRKLVAEGAP